METDAGQTDAIQIRMDRWHVRLHRTQALRQGRGTQAWPKADSLHRKFSEWSRVACSVRNWVLGSNLGGGTGREVSFAVSEFVYDWTGGDHWSGRLNQHRHHARTQYTWETPGSKTHYKTNTAGFYASEYDGGIGRRRTPTFPGGLDINCESVGV